MSVPTGWRISTFDEVVTYYKGGVPFRKLEYSPDGIPVLAKGDIKPFGRVEHSGTRFVDPYLAAERSFPLTEPGDFLMTSRDLTQAAEVLGLVSPIPTDQEYLVNQGANVIRLDEDLVDSRYFVYWCNGPIYRIHIKSVFVGSTQIHIRKPDFLNSPIYLPPLDEQRAISEYLGALDDKIDLNHQMNQTLEALARAIFKSWFVDFDPVHAKARGEQPVGMDAATAALFPDSFEDTGDFGRIPAGWRVTSLEDLFPHDRECVLTGPFGSKLHASDYREEGVPLILVKNVVDGSIVEKGMPLVGYHKTPELDRYRLKEGDIVFTRVGAVGRTAYIFRRYVGWLISGQMLRVRVGAKGVVNPRYLSQVYVDRQFVRMVENHALGTTRPSLNTKILRRFRFLLPTPHVQNHFASLVSAFDAQVQHNLSESRTLSDLRDTLLPKLMSGQLRLPIAEIQE